MGGVEAADVEGRIGLRIAEPLRLLQAFREGETLLVHAGEDVVAGAVEDAVDAGDAAAAEPFAQRLDDRDAAGDRGLEAERRVMRFGQPGERHAVARQQRLVGGDHAAADAERRLDRALGRDRPPRPSARRRRRCRRRGRARSGRRPCAPWTGRASGPWAGPWPHRPPARCGRPARSASAARERCQHRGDGRADRAQSGEAHSQRFGHRSNPGGNRCDQPRLASGTTLCNFSGALSRKRLILRAA